MTSMVKVPPVAGLRATSPREREKVERSSCANYIIREGKGGVGTWG